MAKALPIVAIHPTGQLAENAPLILHTRLEELYQFAAEIADPERVEELHNMRIAAKRLRYTLEIFASCFTGKDFEKIYDQVKSIQEQIGNIHDADVRGPLLQEYLNAHVTNQPEIRVGLETLIKQQHTDRAKKYRSFISYWNKLQRQNFKRAFLVMLADLPLVSADSQGGESQTNDE